jgi:hypothetical protein
VAPNFSCLPLLLALDECPENSRKVTIILIHVYPVKYSTEVMHGPHIECVNECDIRNLLAKKIESCHSVFLQYKSKEI